MPNDAFTQQALAVDSTFRARVRAALATVAEQVVAEADTTANHDNRIAYAYHVLRGLDAEVNVLAPSFVTRPNVFNFETSYTFDFVVQSGRVVTASGDPDLQSQLMSDWNQNAAAAGFNAPPPAP